MRRGIVNLNGFRNRFFKIFRGAIDHKAELFFDAAVEAITDPVTKIGDLIELGSHRILCGDSAKHAGGAVARAAGSVRGAGADHASRRGGGTDRSD